jgi:hypothetical protein
MDDVLGRRSLCSCCTEGFAGLVVIEPGRSGPRTPDPIVVVGRQRRAVVHIVLRCSCCIAEYRAIVAEGETLPMMSRSWRGTVAVRSAGLVEWARCSSSMLDSMPG